MKIPCPQCNKDNEIPNSTHGQRSLRCENCDFLIVSDPAKSSISTGKAKPVRRIIVLPSTKGDAVHKNRQLNRPEQLKKVQILVADKDAINEASSDEVVLLAKTADETEVVIPIAADKDFAPHTARPNLTFRQKWLNIAAVIGAILIFGGGLIVRDQVIAVIPNMAQLYQLAGLDVHSSELEFASVTTKTITKNGGNMLIVEGMIRNISGKTVKVPAVRLLMRTADKRELYSWFHEPEQMRLQAGETMMFTTHLFGPPSDVKDIHLKFTERQKQQAKLN